MELVQYTFLIIVITLSLLLGGAVLLTNKKSRTNIYYFLTSTSISIWVLSSYLTYNDRFSNHATLMGRLNFSVVALFFVSIYAFSRNFPEISKFQLKNRIFIFTGIILSILSLSSNLIVKKVLVTNTRTWEFGPLEYIYYFYGITAALLVVFGIWFKYKKSSNTQKIQIRLMIAGIALVAALNIIFNILVPIFYTTLNIYWIGDYSLVFLLGFTAYAITKHHMFNIRVIATETTVILISIGLIVEIFLTERKELILLKAIVWLLATYGGYALIKSVKKEIKQKEELQKLYKDLEDANKHLKELDETKDNFLSMAAHELNTPISAIEGYLSMIVDEKMCGPLNAKANSYLGNVYQSSKRLAALVRDLLNTSRIESGRIHLIYEEAQIEDVVDQAISEIKIKADNAGHKLIWEKPKALLPVTFLDRPRIIEVIINLLANAVKYTDTGGKIEVETHTDGNKIVVAVKDNGRGIPKDKYDHIFEKFVQVDVLKDEVKGTGLGMFISKNLMELHKGKLWFKSSIDTDDHGTTFYFSLPILKTKPADPNEGQGALLQTK